MYRNKSTKKSKLLNFDGRNAINKNSKVGMSIGNKVLNQNSLLPNAALLKDAVSIKSFKEKNSSAVNNSFEKMMVMESFKQQNKIMFK